ncbi:MAG: hypothetical protein QOI83_4258 [Streptomycetaceae bacterium]|nr:hypothetical protein [Streptomycetaceae bacterium]
MAKVRADGGSARCLHVRIDDPVGHGALIGEFRAAAVVEYGEVLERRRAPHRDGPQAHHVRAEVEESEADLARFETWFAKITARGYFPAQIADEVRTELDGARQALAAFEAMTLAADTEIRPDAAPGEAQLHG